MQRLKTLITKCKQFLPLSAYFLFFSASLYSMDLSEALRIDGFGTVGISVNERKDILFKLYDQTSGIGHGRYDVVGNTVAGLQSKYQLNDSLSFGAQGVVRYEGSDSWKKELEWAYVNYDTKKDISIKFGKFRFPLFQSSELAYVGYSRIYTQPQLFFYGVGGYEHLIGMQANYNTAVGEYDINLRATYGGANDKTGVRPDGHYDSVKSDDVKIVSAKVGSSNFWINVFYTKFTSDITTKGANQPELQKGKTGLNMAGAEFEFRHAGLVLNGGYGKGNVEKFQPDETNIYASLSYPINAFTPYVLYRSKIFSHLPPPPPPLASLGSLPPLQRPPLPRTEDKDGSLSFGCRYDIRPGLALKAQWDRMDAGAQSKTTINMSDKKGADNALSITADWMF